MKENHELFKLNTRRAVVFIFGGIAVSVLSFVVIWQLLFCTGCREMGMAALGALIVITTRIIDFYLSKKMKEE